MFGKAQLMVMTDVVVLGMPAGSAINVLEPPTQRDLMVIEEIDSLKLALIFSTGGERHEVEFPSEKARNKWYAGLRSKAKFVPTAQLEANA